MDTSWVKVTISGELPHKVFKRTKSNDWSKLRKEYIQEELQAEEVAEDVSIVVPLDNGPRMPQAII